MSQGYFDKLILLEGKLTSIVKFIYKMNSIIEWKEERILLE